MEIVKISDLLPMGEQIEIQPDKAIEVFPLNLSQIAKLFFTYNDAFLSLYAEGDKQAPNYTTLLVAAPEMIAEIIAYGARQEDSVQLIAQLPGTVQLIAISAIWKLSVPDPKKLKEALISLMGELQKINATEVPTLIKSENKIEKTLTKELVSQ